MREQWVVEFTERASAYWTEQRLRDVLGGQRFAIRPDTAPVLLRALGLLHRDATMPPKQVRKYRQIGHMVAVLGPTLQELRARHRRPRILDAGCGRSYLTTLLAWTFRHRFAQPVQILGVDHSAALIDECRRRTELVELGEELRYEQGVLDGLDVAAAWRQAFGDEGPGGTHAVFALHACDTATDDAIALGVAERADIIAVAPCCQAELSARWGALAKEGRAGAFRPLWHSPHLRRAAAAHVTDLFRVLLLRAAGYEVSAIEFVASSHTPKNTLIRAVRTSDGDAAAREEYEALKAATGGAGIGLEERVGSRAAGAGGPGGEGRRGTRATGRSPSGPDPD